jgi:hypothetical protein
VRSSVLLLAATMGAGQAFGQAVVPPNVLNYGPGKIDASTAYRYIGQTVTACGRAVQTDVHAADFVMGVSPFETIVFFPPRTDPHIGEDYSLKVVVTFKINELALAICGGRSCCQSLRDATVIGSRSR